MTLSFALSALLSFLSPLPPGAPSVPSVDEQPQAAPEPGGAKKVHSSKKKAAKKNRKTSKRRRRRCSSHASAGYKKMVRNWQKVPKIPGPKWRYGYRDLTLYSVNLGERVRVFPFDENGDLDPDALAAITTVLRDKRTQAEHPVSPRLVKLLYKIALRFDAVQINVISGYRQAREEGGESHHSDGTAVDFNVPGTRLPAVAKVARRFGHVGVGFYPVSGFVHMDVRDGPSYFWADRSGPGKGSCLRRIMPKSGWKFDAKHGPDDDEPVPQTDKNGELKGGPPPEKEPAPSPNGGFPDSGDELHDPAPFPEGE